MCVYEGVEECECLRLAIHRSYNVIFFFQGILPVIFKDVEQKLMVLLF